MSISPLVVLSAMVDSRCVLPSGDSFLCPHIAVVRTLKLAEKESPLVVPSLFWECPLVLPSHLFVMGYKEVFSEVVCPMFRIEAPTNEEMEVLEKATREVKLDDMSMAFMRVGNVVTLTDYLRFVNSCASEMVAEGWSLLDSE